MKILNNIEPMEIGLGSGNQLRPRLEKKLFNFPQKVVQLFRKVEQLFLEGLWSLFDGSRAFHDVIEMFEHLCSLELSFAVVDAHTVLEEDVVQAQRRLGIFLPLHASVEYVVAHLEHVAHAL